MKISLKLLESESQIKQMMMDALLPSCDTYMQRVLSIIKSELPNIVYSAITNRPEYMSLISGTLRLELGIPDANMKVTSIIDTWISNIQYNFKKPSMTNAGIKAQVSAELIRSDFSDVLGLPESNVIDLVNGYSLPWLEWLLLDGSKTIIPGHDVFFGPNPRSRTGGAVMRVSIKGWKVPVEFAGNISDNWITRAIDDAEPQIQDLLTRALS